MLAPALIEHYRAKLPPCEADARISSAVTAAAEYVQTYAAELPSLFQYGIEQAAFLYVFACTVEEKEQLRHSIDALIACGRAANAADS